MGSANGQRCFLLRIELLHTHRPIWREVILPADLGLDIMHEVIQDTMGWDNDHLHQFEHKGIRYETLSMAENDPKHAEILFSLNDLLKRAGSRMSYTYDFGDNWEHLITLKKTLPWDEEKVFTCTGGEGACPLEDCGGVYGYERICHYLEDPKKNDDGFMPYDEWVPEDYDPDFVDFEVIEKCLEELKQVEGQGDEFNRQIADELIDEMSDDPAMDDPLGFFFDNLEDRIPDDEEIAPYDNLSASDKERFKTMFDLGVQVRRAEPWKNFWDQDIFGVRDPASGLLDFVSILGRGGEVFAVHVHRPPESYAFWEKTQTGTLPVDNIAAYLRHLRLVEIQFVKKSELEGADLFLYELLDYPSPKRGKNQWMQFRRYCPRRIPWFPRAEDLPPLIRATALTLRLIDEVRSNPKGAVAQFYRDRVANGERLPSLPIFTRGEEAGDWDSWNLEISPMDWDESGGADTSYQPSEFELERIAALPLVNQTWEVGAVYLEQPISNGTEPVIPIIAIASPTEQIGDPPQPYVSDQYEENPGECIWRAFFKTATERNQRPVALQVTTETGMQTFEAPAAKMGMQLNLVDRFSLIDRFFEMMLSAEF